MMTSVCVHTSEIALTPKRLEFAKEREKDLYQRLCQLFQKKQNDIYVLVTQTLCELHDGLIEKAQKYVFPGNNQIQPLTMYQKSLPF